MRFIRLLFGLLLGAAYAMACHKWLDYVIYYYGSHSTFLYGGAYREATVHFEGWTGYIDQWLTAMMAGPWTGIIILSALCASVYWLADALIRAMTHRPDYAAIAVAASIATFIASATTIDGAPTAAWAVPLCLAVALGVTAAVNRLTGRKPVKELGRKTQWVWIACAMIWSGAGYYYILHGINRSERTMILAEKALREGRFDEVMERADAYAAQGHSNKLMTIFRNYVLAQRGELPARLMEQPQPFGADGLAMPWNSDTREAEYGAIPYEAAGHINEALRWETEALVARGATPDRLARLARYNIALGRTEVARKYIRLLAKAPFRIAEAHDLEREAADGVPDGLRYSLRDEGQTPARWANVTNFTAELVPIVLTDSANTVARQYMLCGLLLRNEVSAFGAFMRDHPEPAPLPALYEEALMLCALRDTSFLPMVSPATRNRFAEYAEAARSTSPDILNRRWGQTYWFYINFVSPYGHTAK